MQNKLGADNLVIGVGQTDYSGYPDCRNDFIISANHTINLAFDHEFVIHTPLMWKTKAGIWEMADELGVFDMVRTQTVTCYNGIPGEGCGECPSCRLRQTGLNEYLSLKCIRKRLTKINQAMENFKNLGKKSDLHFDYDKSVLESFENKHPDRDYWVKFNCPEFTSLCPDYRPARFCHHLYQLYSG